MARHRRRQRRLGSVLLAVLVVTVAFVVVGLEALGDRCAGATCQKAAAIPTPTTQVPDAFVPTPQPEAASPVVTPAPSAYQGVGTWLSRYRFTREFGGARPPVSPADVDAMADAGVQTLYLQPAADDPRFPDLLSTDLLGRFVVRAHERGMKVVGWYLPHFTDVDGDLRRLQAMLDFRADRLGFDAIAVDIEYTEGTGVAERNAALLDLSRRLRAAAPDAVLGAIVLPPVVTDVLNTRYWPGFPWQDLAGLYQVWLPMAYWSDRKEDGYVEAHRYISENVTRLREHLGDACAAVSVVGGWGTGETAADYEGMTRAATEQKAVGVSIFDWPTTPPSAWPPLRGYTALGC